MSYRSCLQLTDASRYDTKEGYMSYRSCLQLTDARTIIGLEVQSPRGWCFPPLATITIVSSCSALSPCYKRVSLLESLSHPEPFESA
jgi:hypothetical protein